MASESRPGTRERYLVPGRLLFLGSHAKRALKEAIGQRPGNFAKRTKLRKRNSRRKREKGIQTQWVGELPYRLLPVNTKSGGAKAPRSATRPTVPAGSVVT